MALRNAKDGDGEAMKIVFICSPYSALTDFEKEANIARAKKEAQRWWGRGYGVFCPHLNSAWMSGICPEENFLEFCMLMLEHCHVLAATEYYENSSNCVAEVKRAFELGLTVYVCDRLVWQ